MNKVLLILLSVVIGTGIVAVILHARLQSASPSLQWTDHQHVSLRIGTLKPMDVEVVNTPASTAQGLSDRDQIGAAGMLFVLEKNKVPVFWMKDMKFDLDIVWINDNTVVGIERHVPKPSPGIVPTDLPKYSPNQEAEMVLELPAGSTEILGIHVGDQISFQ